MKVSATDLSVGAKKTTGRRRVSLVWRIAGAVLAVFLIAVYGRNVYICSRFESSGDPLFDRYAKAAINRSAWKLFHSWGGHPASLPPKLVESWEGEFGDDPRYWRLKAWNAAAQFELDSLANDDAYFKSRVVAIEVLEGAQLRGLIDADGLAVLYILKRELAGEIPDASQAEDLSSLFSKLLESSPNLAWPDFYLATRMLKSDNPHEAVGYLKSALKKGDTHLPSLSPLALIELGSSADAAGNQMLFGAILSCQANFETLPEAPWIEAMDLARQLARQGDTEGQTALHRYGCWLAMETRPWIGLKVVREMAYARLMSDEELGPDRRELLCALIDRQQGLESNWSSYYGYSGTLSDQLLNYNMIFTTKFYQYYSMRPPEMLPGLVYVILTYNLKPAMRYRYIWGEHAVTELHKLHHSNPTLRNMALIDYSTLELPAKWENIEAESGFPLYGIEALPEHMKGMHAEPPGTQ